MSDVHDRAPGRDGALVHSYTTVLVHAVFSTKAVRKKETFTTNGGGKSLPLWILPYGDLWDTRPHFGFTATGGAPQIP